MWPFCSANSFLWLLLPFLIGLLTGWWAWAGRKRKPADTRPAAAPPVDRTPPSSTFESDRMRAADVPPAPDVQPLRTPDVPLAAAAAPLLGIGIPAAVGAPDDLTQIKGVGPKLNDLLVGLGIRRFDQIAAWGRSEIDKVDAHLVGFHGRIGRDEWVEQAKLLARGAVAEFEARFGKLDGENH